MRTNNKQLIEFIYASMEKNIDNLPFEDLTITLYSNGTLEFTSERYGKLELKLKQTLGV